jgi:hypothetical protein
MTRRLVVLIPEELAARIDTAVGHDRISKGAWIRRAIEAALERHVDRRSGGIDPLLRLTSLQAPTADIGDMISEIGSGGS